MYKRIKQDSILKGVKLTVNCLTGMNYRLFLELDYKKKRIFMDRFFLFLLRTKSVLRLKNLSRTGKTDDFSSPGGYFEISVFEISRINCILKSDHAMNCSYEIISFAML